MDGFAEAGQRLLDGEKRLLEMVAMGRALPSVLEAQCGLMESATGCHCSVLLVEPAGATIRDANRAAEVIARLRSLFKKTCARSWRTTCRRWSATVSGSRDKTLKLYEGHYHDLFNDIGKEGVMADVKGWIDAHLPKA